LFRQRREAVSIGILQVRYYMIVHSDRRGFIYES
jgi:hypothetical protein